MSLQRRREKPLIICCLAALTLVLCGCSIRATTASASTDETSKGRKFGGSQIADFFSSLYGNNARKPPDTDASDGQARNIQLSAGQLSAFIKKFQQSQNQPPEKIEANQADGEYHHNHRKDRHRGKSNRRKVLYDLSVRAHYERLLHEQESRNVSSSVDDAISSCEYYNDGMQSAFDIREMATDDRPFSRSSHWTYKLCPKKSISQIHVEPSAITQGEEASDPQSLKLPPNSILSSSIQFAIPTIHDLGSYLPPQTPDYKSLISAAWGADEAKSLIPNDDLVEYYVGGDSCKVNGRAMKNRQSKVIYDGECCQRSQRMMEEFFLNDGQIMIRSTAEPEPCRYVLKACNICRAEEVRRNETSLEAEGVEQPSSVDPSDFGHMLQTYLQYMPSEIDGGAFPPMPPSQIEANKQLLQSMFTHAYDSYFYNAFPASELKPLTCQPGLFDLVRIPALTLIDTLDTFIIMGNYTEFARSIERLRYLDERMKREFQTDKAKSKESKVNDKHRDGEEGGLFSVNQNVSVFETTIRVLGGLLSAHQMAVAFMSNLVLKSDIWDSSGDVLSGTSTVSSHAEVESKKFGGDVRSNVETAHDDDSNSCTWEPSPCSVDDGHECAPDAVAANKEKHAASSSTKRNEASSWEYDGFLLDLAFDIGKRLLFAFDTETGIPYGTINLLNGIPPGETTVASLAGAGTLSLEFELLSRLTGDQSFGNAAKLATRALWVRRSPELNLFGKHIDAQSGHWKEILSGVGSNSDSFYEYLVKHYLLFPDDHEFWTMFLMAYSGVQENSRLGEWYVDVDMGHGLDGNVRQVFESLMAFYPGLQILLGEVVPSAKTLSSFFLVREFLGLLPERFNFAHWKTEGSGDVHPLRPELLESCYFLHLATIGLHGSKCGPCSKGSSSPHTSSWLWAADFALHAVHKLSWTPCGFATVTKVGSTTTGGLNLVGENSDPQTEQKRLNIQHHNEMPSYFLSETIKYLYLTFDAENSILYRDERDWIFTTEAHLIHHVPVSNSTMQGTDHLNAQLDQVRSLLKEGISNSPSLIDEGSSTNASVVRNSPTEQWSQKQRATESLFEESIRIVDREIIAGKQENDGIHDFESGPRFHSMSSPPSEIASYGIFSSEISAINRAHIQFESRGMGSGDGLGKRCPNFHHPDLQWTHALHGDALNYNAAHYSSVSDKSYNINEGVDERMLTALASLCFYGTDYFADGVLVDKSNSCLAEDAPGEGTTNSKHTNTEQLQPSTSAPIPGATRYDMGSAIGSFDVSAFPSGDGFVVKHVDSDELLEVSIFHENPESPDDSNSGTVILVVLTVPPQKPSEPQSTRIDGTSSFLSSRRASGGSWRRLLGGEDLSEGDTEPELLDNKYRRNVVVADMETNSFKCEVVITKKSNTIEPNEISVFPCSPAFFGRANMPNLRKSGGEIVKGLLSPPPPGNELGCQPPEDASPFDQEHVCQVSDRHVQDESNVLQIVRRGDCNFMRKATYHRHVAGVIVVNSNPYELFVMAGEKSTENSGCSNDDLPVSVLVSGEDGDSIIELLHDEESVVFGTILLTEQGTREEEEVTEDHKSMQFPHVKGSKEALQILARNGWGIHAVPQTQAEQNGWQLFITQHHDKTV